jgi:hypothetical protein
LLTLDDLKDWVHRDLATADKVLLTLATFDQPVRVQEIKARARNAGSVKLGTWNISQVLDRTKGLAINTKVGWELTNRGKEHLRTLGISKLSTAAIQVAVDLKSILRTVENVETRAFVEETVKCYEFELYRSAVVMSWLAAMHVLKSEVVEHHISEFNVEAQRVDSKWRPAKTTDDLGLMKEHDFLNRIASISVIGKNVKEELQNCLKLRNACGHPNSLKLGANAVAGHLEILIFNVFQKFAK